MATRKAEDAFAAQWRDALIERGAEGEFLRERWFYEPEGPLPPSEWRKGGPSINQGSAPSAWTPANLPNLVAWYDAQDASSIILNGSTVAQWNDKSGHGYNAVQGTAANQPTYNATGLNGKPALVSNGSTTCMSASVPAGAFPSAIAFANVLTDTGAAQIWGLQRSNVQQPVYFNFQGHAQLGNGSSASATPASAPGPWSTPTLLIAAYDDAVKIYTDWINGTQTDQTTGISMTYADAATSLKVQGIPGWWIMTGALGEAVACAGISTSDRQKLEGYMAWRWGLQGSLPAGHPYKSAPP